MVGGQEGGGMGGGGKWAAGGGLYLSIGLFGSSMSLVIGPDKPRSPKRCLTNTGLNIRW